MPSRNITFHHPTLPHTIKQPIVHLPNHQPVVIGRPKRIQHLTDTISHPSALRQMARTRPGNPQQHPHTAHQTPLVFSLPNRPIRITLAQLLQTISAHPVTLAKRQRNQINPQPNIHLPMISHHIRHPTHRMINQPRRRLQRKKQILGHQKPAHHRTTPNRGHTTNSAISAPRPLHHPSPRPHRTHRPAHTTPQLPINRNTPHQLPPNNRPQHPHHAPTRPRPPARLTQQHRPKLQHRTDPPPRTQPHTTTSPTTTGRQHHRQLLPITHIPTIPNSPPTSTTRPTRPPPPQQPTHNEQPQNHNRHHFHPPQHQHPVLHQPRPQHTRRSQTKQPGHSNQNPPIRTAPTTPATHARPPTRPNKPNNPAPASPNPQPTPARGTTHPGTRTPLVQQHPKTPTSTRTRATRQPTTPSFPKSTTLLTVGLNNLHSLYNTGQSSGANTRRISSPTLNSARPLYNPKPANIQIDPRLSTD